METLRKHEGGSDIMANKNTGSYLLRCQHALEEEAAYQWFDFPNCHLSGVKLKLMA